MRIPYLAAAATDGPLLRRIRRVLGLAPSQADRSAWWLPGALILTTAVALATGLALSPETAQAEEDETMTITGMVLDPEGGPIAHAEVMVTTWPRSLVQGPEQLWGRETVLGQGRSDAEGHFHLQVPAATDDFPYRLICAIAPGFAIGWTHDFDPSLQPPEAVIRLAREHALQGRLVDLQGQPAAGVPVSVGAVAIKQDSIEEAGEGLRSWMGLPHTEPLPVWPGPATTDEEGRFVLHGLARDWFVTLFTGGPDFPSQRFEVRNEDLPADGLTLALAPGHVIAGRVVAEDTSQPITGAFVIAHGGTNRGGIPQAWTDEDGRFRLLCVPAEEYHLDVYPQGGVPYLFRTTRVTWPQGAARQQVEIALPRGVLLRGQVIEEPSGTPVAGAFVEYHPQYDDNPHYRSELSPYMINWQHRARSGPDGAFQLAVLPGPGHLLIKAPTQDYIKVAIRSSDIGLDRLYYGSRRLYPDGLVPLDIDDEAQTHEATVKLRRGVTVQGRVVGPDGTPLARGLVLCHPYLEMGFEYNMGMPILIHDGRFSIPGRDPTQPFTAFFLDLEKDHGAAVAFPDGPPAEPVTVRLESCGTATARFLDPEGQPHVGLRPRLRMVVTPEDIHFDEDDPFANDLADDFSQFRLDEPGDSPPRTDADGRIILTRLIPGATYRVYGMFPTSRFSAAIADPKVSFTAESGQTLELPDITIDEPR